MRLSRLDLEDERGFSLVELLVVIMLVTVVGGATVGGIVAGYRSNLFAQNRVDAVSDLQIAIERVGRDIRVADSRDVHGGAIRVSTPTQLVLDVYRERNNALRRIRYTYTVEDSTAFPGTRRLRQTEDIWNDPAANTATAPVSSTSTMILTDAIVGTATTPVFSYYAAGACISGCAGNLTAALSSVQTSTTFVGRVDEVVLTVRRDTRNTGAGRAGAIEVSTRATLRNRPNP